MHIILGGTSGLGLEMARQLRKNGKRVLVLGKTHNTHEHGEGFPLDVYYPEQVEAAPARIEQILSGRRAMAGAVISRISLMRVRWRRLISLVRCHWCSGRGIGWRSSGYALH